MNDDTINNGRLEPFRHKTSNSQLDHISIPDDNPPVNQTEKRIREISQHMEAQEKNLELWLEDHKNNVKDATEKLTNFEITLLDELSSDNLEEESERLDGDSSTQDPPQLPEEEYVKVFSRVNIEKERDSLLQRWKESFKGNTYQLQEYLESKLHLLQAFRHKKFHSYYRNKNSESDKARQMIIDRKQNTLETLLKTQTPNYITKNSRIIEKKLMNLFDLVEMSSEGSSELDEFPLKKIKMSNQNAVAVKKKAGYSIGDFMKMPRYRIDPVKLPSFSSFFEDARKDMLSKGDGYFLTPNKAKNSLLKAPNRNFSKGANKKVGEVIQEDPANKVAKFTRAEYPAFVDDMKKNLLNEKDKEKAKLKTKNMTLAEKEKYEKSLLKKHWQGVVRGVIRIYKFATKFRMDFEMNTRKFAYFCAKEVKRRMMKNQRNSREHMLRAKRMHREMLIYWRRREKELNELKKKKEKLEMEIKRREEEERESLLQRRRLEYLMKQSGLYSHFMAKKLGMADDVADPNTTTDPAAVGPDGLQIERPRRPELEIDENAAMEEVQNLINEHRKTLHDFDLDTQKQRIDAGGPEGDIGSLNLLGKDELMQAQQILDFSNADTGVLAKTVDTPKSFQGELKEYQVKGLRWLDNLYEQGINGILADEMGLGKTIQAIALLAHLSEGKANWGPFLIVAPSSTLFNWQQEIKRFCPQLKVLPYWGGLKERKTIRKYFNQKTLGTPNSPFHIVVTSYQLVVADEKSFQRLRWQYMILDEAQAIKNINSQRWKILLSFNSRNRLLLTGTPIQNTMAELWALLHFIMPKLFDSHDQFQEWFSKDIEAHSVDQKSLNQHQLSKLHAILKPFMLRRVKKDVENEIGQKKEFQIFCKMTKRQQILYDTIKEHLSLIDFFQMFESKAKVENLMNLVMQFRKVCNHPELFERRQCKTPFSFHSYYYYTGNLPVSFGQLKDITISYRNPVKYQVPKLVYDEMTEDFGHNNKAISKQAFIKKYFSVFSSHHIHQSLFPYTKERRIVHNSNLFSFTRFTNIDEKILELTMNTDQLYSVLVLLHALKTANRLHSTHSIWEQVDLKDTGVQRLKTRYSLWINDKILNVWNYSEAVHGLLSRTTPHIRNYIPYNIHAMKAYLPTAMASYPDIRCSSSHFMMTFSSTLKGAVGQKLIFGSEFQTAYSLFSRGEGLPHLASSILVSPDRAHKSSEVDVLKQGMFEYPLDDSGTCIEIPSFESLIADSCKMHYLNQLLPKLKKENHRVLIFCQMTKMMDILEEYLVRKQYQYFRLDGSCNVADRRDMVTEFQTNPNIFAFILSTRAGGLGVTLTAADTVIFYDNDWNPTMDAQATDRAHRIGQTKDVYVYRLIVKSSIEERIVKRAQQKQNVQATVYSGGAFKAEIFKRQEVMELLFDENEIDMTQTNKFMPKSAGPKKKAAPKKEKKETKQPAASRSRRRGRNAEAEPKDDMEIEDEKDKDEDMEGMDFFSNLMSKDDE